MEEETMMGAGERVVQIKKQLEKMKVIGAEQSQVLDLLMELRALPMNLDILDNTRIIVTISQLQKWVTEKGVIVFAKNLLMEWKRYIPAAPIPSSLQICCKRKQIANGESFVNKMTGLETKNNPELVVHTNHPSRARIITSPPSVRTTDPTRLKCKELLLNALTGNGNLPDGAKDPESLSDELEHHIFNEFRNTATKYKRRIRSRAANLKDNKNPNLCVNFLLGKIGPSLFAKMTAEEMASDELKSLRNKFESDAFNSAQLATDLGIETDLLVCNNCKSTDCKNRLLVRSDERRGSKVTRLCFCCSCGHQWKQPA